MPMHPEGNGSSLSFESRGDICALHLGFEDCIFGVLPTRRDMNFQYQVRKNSYWALCFLGKPRRSSSRPGPRFGDMHRGDRACEQSIWPVPGFLLVISWGSVKPLSNLAGIQNTVLVHIGIGKIKERDIAPSNIPRKIDNSIQVASNLRSNNPPYSLGLPMHQQGMRNLGGLTFSPPPDEQGSPGIRCGPFSLPAYASVPGKNQVPTPHQPLAHGTLHRHD
ncbi:conserved hypothetical protein [Coccidioides posadasii str. Silveira]|uniref:Uncharacterized protein n=1 Tax=Coccidioides posadasii (strain RMSCC 757 / Silveira) TaxID=443226 RepID=E9D4T9_COCPS|nr:conserved hypothetical protein [Coccidioides posadasii str. Silveira]